MNTIFESPCGIQDPQNVCLKAQKRNIKNARQVLKACAAFGYISIPLNPSTLLIVYRHTLGLKTYKECGMIIELEERL